MRALFAENPGYRAWRSLYDATKCFKSRGTDGSARCHSSAAMNHQLGTPPSMGPLRAVKSAVRATYGENAGSRACHSSCGPTQCVQSHGIDGEACRNASVAVKPQHGAPPSMGLSRAVKSDVRAPYGENAESRACHSSVGPAQCVESRGIDGGARWNAPVAVKPPHPATPSMGLSWAVKSAVRPPYAENSGSRA